MDIPIKIIGGSGRPHTTSTSVGRQMDQSVLPTVLEKPITDEQLIEFEQALLAQTVIPAIISPCPKRTMNFGPKKFVGKVPNNQIHQYTGKKVSNIDFDTFSMLQSTTS